MIKKNIHDTYPIVSARMMLRLAVGVVVRSPNHWNIKSGLRVEVRSPTMPTHVG